MLFPLCLANLQTLISALTSRSYSTSHRPLHPVGRVICLHSVAPCFCHLKQPNLAQTVKQANWENIIQLIELLENDLGGLLNAARCHLQCTGGSAHSGVLKSLSGSFIFSPASLIISDISLECLLFVLASLRHRAGYCELNFCNHSKKKKRVIIKSNI